jgi:hypothetical protein
MILWELVTERYPWQDQLRTVEGECAAGTLQISD